MAEANAHSNSNDEATIRDFLYIGVALVVGGVVLYFSWPISPLLLVSLASWWLTSAWPDNPWGKALAGFFGPLTVGIALLSLMLLVVNLFLFAFALDPTSFAVLADGVWRVEHFLRSAESLLGKWRSLGLWTFPSMMLALIILNGFLSRWRLVARFLLVQRILSATFLALLVATSFTFLGKPVIGDLADDAHTEWKIAVHRNLEPVAQELAAEALAKAVDGVSDEDREVFINDFQDIRNEVVVQFPYLPLIEGQRRQSFSASDAFHKAQEIIERTLTDNPIMYIGQRKTREQRAAELELEASQTLDRPEEYIKKSLSLEAGCQGI